MKEYKLTIEDFVQLNKLHFGGLFFAMQMISGFLLLVFLYGIYQSESVGNFDSYFEAFPIFFFGISIIMPFFQKGQIKRAYDSNRKLQEPVQVSFNDKGIKFKSASGYQHLFWDDFHKYKVNQEIIAIYESISCAKIIPKRAFQNDEEQREFAEILKEHVGDKHDEFYP
ncbi:hypothetical protein COV82_02505 [Candidatus Peregrinibacteria bacterium CG11_big_fil_rev_8_21_14_0_20_46_8]|nr:MAG: hypothetical protein COV82_02505 [Candidatus Peregrinibacteria bacterium CG11_big_fil_rev_8_21_14_0_20_46_8]